MVEWKGQDPGVWLESLEGTDAVINLAGAPIADARWTDARKRLLTDSRVHLTRRLVEAISHRAAKPSVLISASGIGYYGPSDDRVLNEAAPPGQGFLADLSVAWEEEARRATEFGTRVVLLRSGMVLERDGGALPKMLLPFRLYVGPINAVAPEPERMQAFCATLGRVLRRPSWIPVPETVLSVALGELGTVMTTGQRVSPQKALAGGYVFQYPALEPALRAILKRA